MRHGSSGSGDYWHPTLLLNSSLRIVALLAPEFTDRRNIVYCFGQFQLHSGSRVRKEGGRFAKRTALRVHDRTKLLTLRRREAVTHLSRESSPSIDAVAIRLRRALAIIVVGLYYTNRDRYRQWAAGIRRWSSFFFDKNGFRVPLQPEVSHTPGPSSQRHTGIHQTTESQSSSQSSRALSISPPIKTFKPSKKLNTWLQLHRAGLNSQLGTLAIDADALLRSDQLCESFNQPQIEEFRASMWRLFTTLPGNMLSDSRVAQLDQQSRQVLE